MNTLGAGVVLEVIGEQDRQHERWGEQNHPPLYWLGILMEEVGEVAKAAIEANSDAYRAELIHVAAVAQTAAECFDRQSRALPEGDGCAP